MIPGKNGIIFLPTPKTVEFTGNNSQLPASSFGDLNPTCGVFAHLPAGLTLHTSTNQTDPQGYVLVISLKEIRIEASSEKGWFHGLQTLKQLARKTRGNLPQCRIEDWPDFANRGVMLDISRNKVPTLKTLYYLIDLFAQWKVNQLQLYIEHTFAYRGHETVWKNASPLTHDDIHELDTYCKKRFIELVPNLNCFGHMARWLIHDRYRPLAENPQGGKTDFGFRKDPQGLCPSDPGSIALAKDLIQQMAPCFKSTQVNVGCDETIDLGFGRSKRQVKELGRGRVYLEYLKKVHRICEGKGYTMQFWADILLKYPELAPEVPTGCIALNWGYEADHPFATETACLRKSGTPFYVCPGTSSWNSIGGRTANMVNNINSAATHGKSAGAIGLMITDWGDNGHWQPLVSSFPGLVLGAAQAWNFQQNFRLYSALDQHVFHAEGWGKLLLDIGSLDSVPGIKIHNRSILFNLLQQEAAAIKELPSLTVGKMEETITVAEHLKTIKTTLLAKDTPSPILEEEIDWIIKILIHACRRGIFLKEGRATAPLIREAEALREEHQRLWFTRNRPGGYLESRALFDNLIHS